MKEIKVSESMVMYAEKTRDEYQTVSGRISQLAIIGAQYEEGNLE